MDSVDSYFRQKPKVLDRDEVEEFAELIQQRLWLKIGAYRFQNKSELAELCEEISFEISEAIAQRLSSKSYQVCKSAVN